MQERDYLAEQAAYLKKDLGKNNISQNLFQRFKELITDGRLPAGSPMFIPKKLNTIVGIDIMIVKTAKNFILKFKLFEMIDENDSIVPARTDV